MWQSRAASVIGREHVRLGRNNQDGFAIAERAGLTAVVVTDGCSSEPRSEVGAQLAARFLASWVVNHGTLDAALPLAATEALTSWIYRVACTIDGAPEALLDVVQRHFLFTFLCAVAGPTRSIVFGIGDGAFCVDGVTTRLDAGPENAPAYCAYRLLSGRRPEPQLHFLGEATQLAVMTDGFDTLLERDARALAPMLADPVVWKNPAHLQRRLNVLAQAERFTDDATLAVCSRNGG